MQRDRETAIDRKMDREIERKRMWEHFVKYKAQNKCKYRWLRGPNWRISQLACSISLGGRKFKFP